MIKFILSTIIPLFSYLARWRKRQPETLYRVDRGYLNSLMLEEYTLGVHPRYLAYDGEFDHLQGRDRSLYNIKKKAKFHLNPHSVLILCWSHSVSHSDHNELFP